MSRARFEDPLPQVPLGGEGWVRGLLLLLCLTQEHPLTPTLSPGVAGGEGVCFAELNHP